MNDTVSGVEAGGEITDVEQRHDLMSVVVDEKSARTVVVGFIRPFLLSLRRADRPGYTRQFPFLSH